MLYSYQAREGSFVRISIMSNNYELSLTQSRCIYYPLSIRSHIYFVVMLLLRCLDFGILRFDSFRILQIDYLQLQQQKLTTPSDLVMLTFIVNNGKAVIVITDFNLLETFAATLSITLKDSKFQWD